MKPSSSVRALLAALLLSGAGAAFAQQGPACEPPVSEDNPLGQRRELLSRYEQLPVACLRRIVQVCTARADSVVFDQGSMVVCSLGYEALLSQGFGGNFQALMAWWRTEGREGVPRL